MTPAPAILDRPLQRRCSNQQALAILKPNLPCQMLAQRLLAVRPEIIVEIPEPWFQHPYGNPGITGSGAQPLCRALPGRIAVYGDVEALQPLQQLDRTEVTRREHRPDGKAASDRDSMVSMPSPTTRMPSCGVSLTALPSR